MGLDYDYITIDDILEILDNKGSRFQTFGLISNMEGMEDIHQISQYGFVTAPSIKYISHDTFTKVNEFFSKLHFHNYHGSYDDNISDNRFSMMYNGERGIRDVSHNTSNTVTKLHKISKIPNKFIFDGNTGDYEFASWIYDQMIKNDRI